MKKEPYLVEINHPSLTEYIDEKYDSITTIMPPNAVIYGSALTSLISGLPADGDLDIAISPSEYSQLATSLQTSSKWLQIEGTHVKESQSTTSKLFGDWGMEFSPPSEKFKSSKYKDIPDFPLEETVAFQDVNGSKVQAIKSKQNTTDPLDDALSVVRKVDFAFCGMAMDKYGRIMESIPHAYSDCCAGVIRMANYRLGEDVERARGRINKYLKRGWSLAFALDLMFERIKEVPKTKDKETQQPKFVVSKSKYIIKALNFRGFSCSINRFLKDLSGAFGTYYDIHVTKSKDDLLVLVPRQPNTTWALLERDCEFLNQALKHYIVQNEFKEKKYYV